MRSGELGKAANGFEDLISRDLPNSYNRFFGVKDFAQYNNWKYVHTMGKTSQTANTTTLHDTF